MRSVLGCGGAIEKEHLAKIRRTLHPMWETLPKNGLGRVGQRSLRYLAHRYFMRRFGIVVRGFEPYRPANESHWGAVDILSHRVPWYVEAALESEHAKTHGFALSDAVYLVVALEDLVLESERALLVRAYAERPQEAGAWPLGRDDLKSLLESYLVRWLLRGDKQAIAAIAGNAKQLETSFPRWHDVSALAEGQIRALDYARQRGQRGRHGRRVGNAFSQGYSFDEAYEMVRAITESFASFWVSECTAMEDSLVAMDRRGIGRVPLRKFYEAALRSNAGHFTESEAYLRELGAIDNASVLLGKQLVIPNYMQSLSNCPVSAWHYLVCCPNRCDDILAEVESAVRAPAATTAAITAALQNLTVQSSLAEEYVPELGGLLSEILEHIATANGGQVPLHGRLFAQFLHYAFPRECPFPHKASVSTLRTRSEFGEGAQLSQEDLFHHANDRLEDFAEEIYGTVHKEIEPSWMLQWSHQEELALEHYFGYEGIEPREEMQQTAGNAFTGGERERLEADLLEEFLEQHPVPGLLAASSSVSAILAAAGLCGIAALRSFACKGKACGAATIDLRTHTV